MKNGDDLAVLPSPADRDDLFRIRQIEALDRNFHAKDLRLERQRELVFEHGVKAHSLFRFVVAIDCGFLDQPVELGCSDPRPASLGHFSGTGFRLSLGHVGSCRLGMSYK